MYNMRELIFREDGQEYAKVRAVLGDGRFKLDCYDNQIRLGHIRGSLRFKSVPPKKRRPVDPSRPTKAVKSGDIVLISLRDFDPKKADIIHRYSDEEARDLQSYGELPAYLQIGENSYSDHEQDFGFDFDHI